jgi:hypothetical protein
MCSCVTALRFTGLGFTALSLAALSQLVACRAVVDADVTYRECERVGYLEEFAPGTTLEGLKERCWQVDNPPSDVPALPDLFVDDDDLVMRVVEPLDGVRQQWRDGDEAPMIFQRIESDFLVVTRIEALDKVSGDHCLAEGNMAGIVARRSADEWSTYLLGPFTPDPPATIDCSDDSDSPPPTLVQARSRGGSWGADLEDRGVDHAGVGIDGEADIALCRLHGTLIYYYRDPESTAEEPTWTRLGSHDVGTGGLDVGLTVSGWDPFYEAEGHFAWALYDVGIAADGCAGALEPLVLPAQD